MGVCLSDQDLAFFLEGTATPEVMDQWQTHLARCWPCTVRVAQTLQDPSRQSVSRAHIRHVLEAVEGNPVPPPEPGGGGGPVVALLSALWKRRLSAEEKYLLREMARAGGRAIVSQEPGQPLSVLVGGRSITDAVEESIRRRYVGALEVDLVRRGYVTTYNGRVYDLTSRGLGKAQRLG